MIEKNSIYKEYKYLTAERLIELLEKLPKDARLSLNDVKNMSILTKVKNKYVCTGFIDFLLEGEIDMWEKENKVEQEE